LVLDVFLKGPAVVRREPDDAGHLPEPGHLPFGVAAGVGLRESEGLVAADSIRSVSPTLEDVFVLAGEGRSSMGVP